ncbi:MAG: hypothetical protein OEZ37_07415, partial [Gemmatimonadota bacterium]|nr:hypothetical protein [Gemmatimonadota bacterium]
MTAPADQGATTRNSRAVARRSNAEVRDAVALESQQTSATPHWGGDHDRVAARGVRFLNHSQEVPSASAPS